MKLKQKIILLNISTLLIMLIALGIIISNITDNYNLYTRLQYLQGQGDYAATYIEQYVMNKSRSFFDVPAQMESNADYLSEFLEKTVNCRVQIYYGNSLLGDSEDIVAADTIVRPEVAQTFQKNSAYYISKSPNRTFYYAAPVVIGNKYTYSVAFIYSLAEIDKMKNNTIQMFVITGLISSIIVLLVGTAISNMIIYPIKALNHTTKQFSKGDLNSRAVITTHDEVGELSHTFNSMADNIHEMITKLNNEKEKQKSFFDNFTHEIRTPLTTILGYTDLLWKTNDEEVKDRSLFHIDSEGKRMLKMVESLLELSKLKKFDMEINKQNTNIKQLIEEVCDSMQYKARRYNISFRLNLEPITYIIDPDMFKQMVINIIDNSIKYSKSQFIDITLTKNPKLSLVIEDYGLGISPKSLENVFEPYYKVDKSRNSKIEGWGLGLSIVKEIVNKHDGTINIVSTLDKGTRIEISL
ncbi:MAG: two-component sensor histidine kinase [Clostridia bacterium]|nr:two-component sensor histidine kinase [Clostridia bacterium]